MSAGLVLNPPGLGSAIRSPYLGVQRRIPRVARSKGEADPGCGARWGCKVRKDLELDGHSKKPAEKSTGFLPSIRAKR